MSAVMEAREPSDDYLNAPQPPLVQHFELMAAAPGGVAKLRELILTLAVQGKLVPQDSRDEPASELLKKIQAEKNQLIADGKIKRDKPLAHIGNEEVPFELPSAWTWARLGQVTRKITDGTHHSPTNLSTGDFKYLSAKNIKSWGIDLSDVTYVTAAIHDEIYARCDPVLGDILFIKDGATTGVLTINTLDEPFSLLSSVGVIKPSCGLSSKWLALLMRSPFFYRAMRAGMTGVAITRVTLSKLGAALVPVPPLAEQARIEARVEELMRLCDALEAKGQLEAAQHAQLVQTLLGALTASATPEELADNWQRVAAHFDLLLDRPEAIDALEQTILQLAVRGLLVPQDPKDEPASELLKKIRAEKDRLIAEGKIKRDKPLEPIDEGEKPFSLGPGWAWIQAQEACEPTSLITYGILKPVWVESGVLTVRVQDMKGGEIRLSALGQCSPERAERFDKTKLASGDLLIAKDGATLGKTAFVPPALEGANITQHVLRFPINPKLNRQYVRLVVDSEHGQAWMKSETKGVALPGVNVGDFRRMPIPLPPINEQARIIERVEFLRRLCADLRQRLTARQTTQAHLAEALIDEVA
ncbi:restriction endonuclease subunit S [Hydrogenophaga sp.]|uniref:restriction endonuclease subunit S n=1 Tax=Hydrogenophaga sp. TaxID=1904254 RepID=UPI003F70D6D3